MRLAVSEIEKIHLPQIVFHAVQGLAGVANLVLSADLEVFHRQIVVGDLLHHVQHPGEAGAD
jgi:hypothetical protein